jgi:hypothetical protein
MMMRRSALTAQELRREIQRLGEEHRGRSDDELFVVWFLCASVTEDEAIAVGALTGGAGDKSLDAILIDDARRNVFVVQGKYRKTIGDKSEKRNDIMAFADIAQRLTGATPAYQEYAEGLPADVRQRLDDARERIHSRKYRLHLSYVTTGRCSDGLAKEAARQVQRLDPEPTFQIIGGHQVLLRLSDYLDGVAPPVPSLDLEIESNGGRSDAVMRRYDPDRKIESWLFSISDATAKGLFEHAGVRLFARNVRGWLGKNEINASMLETLKSEPDFFWYYNNGITVVCDDAERKTRGGRDILWVANPQVINGQQTTRALAAGAGTRARAHVLVRVIRVQRRAGDQNGFDSLVSRIVGATNWQNAISAADLMSNDRQQVNIERALRPLGFWYMRKRQPNAEARRVAGSRDYFMIRKEQLAQAVAACEMDPQIVRLGKEGLFEEALYTKVFPNSDPHFYLSRFFLSKAVGAAAKGYPERAYAKWLAIHFTWERLAGAIGARARKEAFVEAFWNGGRDWDALEAMSAIVLRAAIQMYRAQRGKGAKAIDPSSYFKRPGLHRQLERFWKSRANKNRAAFLRAWTKFERSLEERMA